MSFRKKSGITARIFRYPVTAFFAAGEAAIRFQIWKSASGWGMRANRPSII